ncbi:MAG: class I SAM-dependent methyltransferase [Chloroflexi bacterium]|nr:class I SAM-dependent methyltransferase [Chloroflexota bacterium]
MQNREYEYRGAMAQFWDLLRGDTSNWEDKFFYQKVIAESGQPVLDVGCGTGRLLLDYMSQGIDIDGVDNSPEMLALCRQKAEQLDIQPKLYQWTMETLNLPRKYRTIIVPSSSFQLLTDPNDAAEAMRRFYEHLEPGGTLVMSFMTLSTDGEGPFEWQKEVIRPNDGAIVRRWSRSRFDLVNQLEHTEDRYDVVVNGEVVASESLSRSPATRGYTQEQVVKLYEIAGFTNIRLYHGFSFEPATAQDSLFPVLGTKPLGNS